MYRGTLEDGTPIAIKCLDRLGLQVTETAQLRSHCVPCLVGFASGNGGVKELKFAQSQLLGGLQLNRALPWAFIALLGLQGNKEFNVEVSTLGRLRHPNLVTLRGACTQDQHRLAVFDFMPGGSLRDTLIAMGRPCQPGKRPGQSCCGPPGSASRSEQPGVLHTCTRSVFPGCIHKVRAIARS